MPRAGTILNLEPSLWCQLRIEPELHLHGDVLVTDIAGWRREDMSALPKSSAFELGCAGAIRSMYHEVWAEIRVPLAA
jgi:hypothetical protein